MCKEIPVILINRVLDMKKGKKWGDEEEERFKILPKCLFLKLHQENWNLWLEHSFRLKTGASVQIYLIY
jgi:hypothetical protein